MNWKVCGACIVSYDLYSKKFYHIIDFASDTLCSKLSWFRIVCSDFNHYTNLCLTLSHANDMKCNGQNCMKTLLTISLITPPYVMIEANDSQGNHKFLMKSGSMNGPVHWTPYRVLDASFTCSPARVTEMIFVTTVRMSKRMPTLEAHKHTFETFASDISFTSVFREYQSWTACQFTG